MFGYIVPEKPELKIREYELFRIYYCGVCKSIGRRFGQIPRMTLTYDSAFLAMLLSSLDEERIVVNRERCVVHPLKKRHAAGSTEAIDYISDMSMILAYYNLDDKWQDNRSPVGAGGMLALRRAVKKVNRKYPDKCSIIENRLDELHILEKGKCKIMDQAAEPFAKLMEEVLAYPKLCSDGKAEKALRWMGYNMGKWVYILDAFDDIGEDIDKKTYNPLLLQYDYNGGDAETFRDNIREKVKFVLTYCLNQIAAAYELLSNKKNSGVIENVIYLGMLGKMESVLGVRCSSNIAEANH